MELLSVSIKQLADKIQSIKTQQLPASLEDINYIRPDVLDISNNWKKIKKSQK